MSLSLVINDNQANTGATANVSGSDPGTTNTIFILSTALMQLGGQPWYAQATRLGDGAVNLPVYNGYYWSYASGTVAGLPALSPVIYFQASLANQSVYQSIRAAVQAKIQTLNLPGNAQTRLQAVTSDRVYLQGITSERLVMFPAVIVSEEDEQENVSNATNMREDIEYPVRVFIANREDARFFDQNVATYLFWRERIRRAFEYQRLLGVASVWTCTVQPHLVIDSSLQKYQHVVSGMTLRFKSREPRGS